MNAAPHSVLVTGAAGAIGRVVCRALSQRGHAVRAYDRRRGDHPEFIQGDLSDAALLEGACRGVDTVVHLAANPTDAPFLEHLVPDNIVGTWRVFEAARLQGVRRVVVASTLQVVDGIARRDGRPIRAEDGTASRNLYAATKVLCEEFARVYALRHGLSTIAVRIGWLPRGPRDEETIRKSPGAREIYLGRGDCGRFFGCAVEAERPAPGDWAVLFATSLPVGAPPVDLEGAKALIGYEAMERWPEGLEER